MRAAMRSAVKLENIHSDRVMAPALHGYPELRDFKARLPNVCHGTLFIGPPVMYRPDLGPREHHPELEPPERIQQNTGTPQSRQSRSNRSFRDPTYMPEIERHEPVFKSLDVREKYPHLKAHPVI
jgi:hypothetical protein